MNNIEAKERPIIFSGSMVCAILDNRKVQTRRVIKPPPTGKYSGITGITTGFLKSILRYVWRDDKREMTAWRRCPYGAPGNRLWVRETWFPMQDIKACALANEPVDVAYKADYDAEGISREDARDIGIDRWRPSIFMPRWASRIVLEIIDVKVERLQSTTDEDAIAEGIYRHHEQAGWTYTYSSKFEKDGPHYFGKPSYAFRDLWDSLNTKRGFGWDTNPWIWVISFQKLASEVA